MRGGCLQQRGPEISLSLPGSIIRKHGGTARSMGDKHAMGYQGHSQIHGGQTCYGISGAQPDPLEDKHAIGY